MTGLNQKDKSQRNNFLIKTFEKIIRGKDKQEIFSYLDKYQNLSKVSDKKLKSWSKKLHSLKFYDLALILINEIQNRGLDEIEVYQLQVKCLTKINELTYESMSKSLFRYSEELFQNGELEKAKEIISPFIMVGKNSEENNIFIAKLLCKSNDNRYHEHRHSFMQNLSKNKEIIRRLIDYEYSFGYNELSISTSELYFEEFGLESRVLDIYMRAIVKSNQQEFIQKNVDRLIRMPNLNFDFISIIINSLIEYNFEEVALKFYQKLPEEFAKMQPVLEGYIHLLEKFGKAKQRVDVELNLLLENEVIITKPFNLFKYCVKNDLFLDAEKILPHIPEYIFEGLDFIELQVKLMVGLGKTNEAIDIVEKVLSHASKDIDKLISISRNLFKIKLYDLARDVAEQALALDLENQTTKLILSDIAFQTQNWQECLTFNSELIKSRYFDLKRVKREIFLRMKLGLDDTIQSILHSIERMYTNSPKGHIDIGIVKMIYLPDLDYNFHFEMASLMNRRNGLTDLEISKQCMNHNRLDLSIKYLSVALSKGQTNLKILKHAKKIHHILGTLKLSLEQVHEAIEFQTPLFLDGLILNALIKKSHEVNLKYPSHSRSKIMLQTHTLGLGGAERQVVFLLNALQKNQFEDYRPHLLINKIPENKDQSYFYMLDSEIDISTYNINSKIPFEDDIKETLLAPYSNLLELFLSNHTRERIANMYLQMKVHNPKLIHLWQDWGNIHGGVAASMAGIPEVILSARTLPPKMKGAIQSYQGNSYQTVYEKLLRKENVRLIHNSKSGAQLYSKWLNINQNEIEVIYNGTDFDYLSNLSENFDSNQWREELSIPSNAFVVGTIHRFVPEKRPELWLESAIKCIERNTDKSKPFHFILIGDGPLQNKSIEMVNKSKYSNNFHFIGTSNQIAGWLSMLDVFLMTSKIESLPNVLIEAQGFSIPVVSTDAGGAKETFLEGVTGFITEDDSDSISKKILKIYSNDTWSEKAQGLSRKNARDVFGLESMLSETFRLYEEAMK